MNNKQKEAEFTNKLYAHDIANIEFYSAEGKRKFMEFLHNGVWITDPSMDESGRFEVGPDYYKKAVINE